MYKDSEIIIKLKNFYNSYSFFKVKFLLCSAFTELRMVVGFNYKAKNEKGNFSPQWSIKLPWLLQFFKVLHCP